MKLPFDDAWVERTLEKLRGHSVASVIFVTYVRAGRRDSAKKFYEGYTRDPSETLANEMQSTWKERLKA